MLDVDVLASLVMNQEAKNGSLNGLENISATYSNSKRPKILSAIGSVSRGVSSQGNGENGERVRDGEFERFGDGGEVEESSRQIVKDGSLKPEAVQRNKRMFGSLMGHLGIAKRKLEDDSSNIEKRSALQMTVVQKNSMENRRLQGLQREASDAQKGKVSL